MNAANAAPPNVPPNAPKSGSGAPETSTTSNGPKSATPTTSNGSKDRTRYDLTALFGPLAFDTI